MDNNGAVPQQHFGSKPSVLLVATNRWPLAARLACGFLDLGCRVAAVCPAPGHPIRKVHRFKHLYPYAALNPLESLRTAIEEFAPDFIVPLCDRSVQHLHDVHTRCSSKTKFDRRVRELIERSLGPAASYPIVSSRYDLLMLAKDEGIRVPETIRADSVADLASWGKRPPWLLKTDGSWGGRGVRRAETLTSGEESLRELASRISMFRLAKELLLNRDRDRTISSLQAGPPGIIAQAFVPGRPANCAVACWKGELLAAIAVEVLEAAGPCHPAIVVQLVEGREMLEAAKRIAGRLQLTGFFGLDFMIDDETGALYLIEMNPRCTPPCSLTLGEGRDLLGAIWAQLTEQKIPQREAVTDKTRIAYFPQAVQRSKDVADTSQVDAAYLDVPSGEPELVRELLHPWSERSLAGQLLDRLRRNPTAKQASSTHVFKVAQLKDSSNVRQPELAQTVELRP
jgi:hypothetical protein